jgi:uncharacterized protein YecA (UPF0149 family)
MQEQTDQIVDNTEEFVLEPVKVPFHMRKGVTLYRKYEKIGRNDKCPCGSGKKFKHCCINTIGHDQYFSK